MSAIHHPNISRRVYIDSHHYTKDDFLIEFVNFLISLRNLGLDDRHMLVQLSDTLTGSLYGGVEHSTVFEEKKVYDAAIRWAHCRHECSSDSQKLQIVPFKPLLRRNSSYIPWTMRAIISDSIIAQDDTLRTQFVRVLSLFHSWNPTLKPLRDLKYRLDPIKSHL